MACPICKKPTTDVICPTCTKWQAQEADRKVHSGTVRAFILENGQPTGSRIFHTSAYTSPSGEVFSIYLPNLAYFCSECGEIWAREIMQYGFIYHPYSDMPSWSVIFRPCARHGGGSLCTHPFEEYSSDILRREALLEIHHEQQS